MSKLTGRKNKLKLKLKKTVVEQPDDDDGMEVSDKDSHRGDDNPQMDQETDPEVGQAQEKSSPQGMETPDWGDAMEAKDMGDIRKQATLSRSKFMVKSRCPH